jgi:hypothetical protein
VEWANRADLIVKRYPRWNTLERLAAEARALPIAADVVPQIEAVRTNRALLNDPDPVVPLVSRLTQALRDALQREREACLVLYEQEQVRLASAETWKRLTPEQQAEILNRQGIAGMPEIRVGTEQELLASLAEISLESWATRRDALPERFARALEQATKLLEPKAVRVTLPPATLRTDGDLRGWLVEVETRIRAHLEEGPVIV